MAWSAMNDAAQNRIETGRLGMGRKPRGKRHAFHATLGLTLAIALGASSDLAFAGGSDPTTTGPSLVGASPCMLVEGLPAAAHPIRKHPALAHAWKTFDAARYEPQKNARAHDEMVKVIDRLLASAVPAFKAPPSGKVFKPAAAQRYLSAYVLTPNAPLRVGLERFEPAPEVLAALVLSACRAERWSDVIALGRGATLPEARSQRAFAAFVLLAAGRLDEAHELADVEAPDDFVWAFVQAELASDPTEKLRLHRLAGELRKTPDQDLAWRTQERRL